MDPAPAPNLVEGLDSETLDVLASVRHHPVSSAVSLHSLSSPFPHAADILS